jgi:multidrug efflux pump subunit AcrA (membrane-fusion protein)
MRPAPLRDAFFLGLSRFGLLSAPRIISTLIWIDPAMKFSQYLKPALGVVFFVVLAVGYYWFEHRSSHPEAKETPGQALVIVAKTVNACFSDMVRVTGFVVPKREAVVGADQEGSKVTDLFVREGDMVTDNQELARLSAPPQQPGQSGGGRSSGPVSLRAPAAGLVTEVKTIVGAPASPQAGPMFRIAVNNEIELDAEVPSIHMLKLNPGATVRISRDNAPDLVGRVRLVSPQIDRASQLGHVRIALTNNPSLRVGMFARANIDAKRSCGVAVPHTAIDRLTVQVVKGNTVETRKVRVGLSSDTSTEILEGLDVGEIVVADAGTSLHDGDQIKTMFAEELDRVRVR